MAQFNGIGETSAGNACLVTYDEEKRALRQYFVEHMRDVVVLPCAEGASRGAGVTAARLVQPCRRIPIIRAASCNRRLRERAVPDVDPRTPPTPLPG